MKIKFFQNKFYKNVFTLIGGTGIAQSIPIIISPILTRIYTPEDFGVLAFYVAFIAIIGVVATGRFEMAILMPETDKKAKNLAAFSFLVVTVVTFLSLILFLVFGTATLDYLNFGIYKFLIFLIPLGIFAKAIFQVFIYALNRVKYYKAIAGAKITRSFSVSGIQLGLGVLGFSSFGLVFGKFLGDTLASLYGYWLTIKHKRFKNEPIEWNVMKSQATEYKEFPKFNAPHAFTNTSSSNLPNILLVTFFSSSIAGFYSLSHRVCFAPIHLISNSVQQVFSRSITERFNKNEDIHAFTVSVFKQLAIFAIIPFSILLIFAPELFGFVFGHEWKEAGVYSQLLTPFLFLVFIVSPLTYIPLLLNKQRKAFIIDLIYLMLRIIALSVGFWVGNAFIAIAAYSVAGVIIQLYLLYWILSLTRNSS